MLVSCVPAHPEERSKAALKSRFFCLIWFFYFPLLLLPFFPTKMPQKYTQHLHHSRHRSHVCRRLIYFKMMLCGSRCFKRKRFIHFHISVCCMCVLCRIIIMNRLLVFILWGSQAHIVLIQAYICIIFIAHCFLWLFLSIYRLVEVMRSDGTLYPAVK